MGGHFCGNCEVPSQQGMYWRQLSGSVANPLPLGKFLQRGSSVEDKDFQYNNDKFLLLTYKISANFRPIHSQILVLNRINITGGLNTFLNSVNDAIRGFPMMKLSLLI